MSLPTSQAVDPWAVLQDIVDRDDMAAELYTNDADRAGNFADVARQALKRQPPRETGDDRIMCRCVGGELRQVEGSYPPIDEKLMTIGVPHEFEVRIGSWWEVRPAPTTTAVADINQHVPCSACGFAHPLDDEGCKARKTSEGAK